MGFGGSSLTGRAVWSVTLLAALAARAAPASAAESSSDRLVTFAARYCRAYTDIAANRARNNIQESLRDLGADSLYAGGEAVKPSDEVLQQPRCIPLPDWQFTLGRDYVTRAVEGPWGALTKVTSPFATSIVTRDEHPLLDVAGRADRRDAPRRRHRRADAGAGETGGEQRAVGAGRAARRPGARQSVSRRVTASARCAARSTTSTATTSSRSATRPVRGTSSATPTT